MLALAACDDQPQFSESAPIAAAAQEFPELTGTVVDQANLLTTAQELELAGKSQVLEKRTGRQFVIVTVNSLSGRDVADYTTDLANTWGIGRQDHDDGVVLLVAPNERRVRITVGYGLEKTLTDELAGQIIKEDILPRFREGEMSGGILAGADAITSHLTPHEQK